LAAEPAFEPDLLSGDRPSLAKASGRSPEGSEDWWRARGVDPAVAAARPYVRWTTDDIEPVREAYAGLSSGQRATTSRWARQSDGLVITRHAPPGLALGQVYAEIRPDNPVETRPPTWHAHPTVPPSEPLLHPETGRPVQILTGRSMEAHIANEDTNEGHAGMNVEGVHCHTHEAKYVFPPSATIERVRLRDDGSERRYRVKDRSQSLARRIDVHPWAVNRFDNAERVMFALEGCIKADALVSAGEAVFSVPSVTLWDADELDGFAFRYLVGKTVFIVPDADWHTNWMVDRQALLCRTRLRRLGIDTHIAAPPYEKPPPGKKKPVRNGVDDYLGYGGTVDDLVVRDLEASGEIHNWLMATMRQVRRDRALRLAQALEGLSLHANDRGELGLQLQAAAQIMDLDRRSAPTEVPKALRELEELEAIGVEGELDLVEGIFTPRYIRGWQWKKTPLVVVRDQFRHQEPESRRLANVLTNEGLGVVTAPLWEHAAKLLADDGVPHREIADRTGISLSNVKKISAGGRPAGVTEMIWQYETGDVFARFAVDVREHRPIAGPTGSEIRQ
jgi:hypothetical protein